MKKSLFFASTFLTVSLCFSQNFASYETDENGKIFQKTESQLPSVLNQNNKGSLALNLDWSNPDENISEQPTVDSWDPRLEVGNDGTAYVVYSDNHSSGLQKIMFRKKELNQEWSDAIFVDTGGEIGGRNNHFGAIAASPNGDLHVTYNVWAFENIRNYVAYSYYEAATDTWNDGVKISDAGGTVNHTSGRHDLYSTEDNLPVVVWGYDFRENQVNEEIYMKYFDGTDWSSDIAVSDVTDSQNAGYPYIRSIGDSKAMILYSEKVNGGSTELKYRIYDEVTHDLSAAKIITLDNVGTFNYNLAYSSSTDEVMVLTWHGDPSPKRDIIRIYDYDAGADSFTLSANTYEDVSPDAGSKRMSMDCNSEGDCAVVFTNFFADTNSVIEYNSTDGFGTPLVINEENPALEEPNCKFDPNGSLHVVWNDKRFDDGQGFDEREVFYEKGVNLNLGTNDVAEATIAVYPNPSNGKFTISTTASYTMEIYDVLGRMYSAEAVSGTTTVTKTLSPGTYFLHFKNEEASFVKKILVQ